MLRVPSFPCSHLAAMTSSPWSGIFNLTGIKQYLNYFHLLVSLPRWLNGKESVCQCPKCRRREFNPWDGKIPWRRKWQPTPVFLPGEFCGQRSLAGYSPWGGKKSDATERLGLFKSLMGTSRHLKELLSPAFLGT